MMIYRLHVLPLLLLVLLLGLGWSRHQQIQDWWKMRGYTPSSAIVQLANEDTMNGYTKHLFYLNKPELPTTVSAFRKNCPENQDTIVLGCYHPDQNGIFIYAVQDQQLAGIQQVTAAHEVLHAVYARLSSADRAQLNSELESYYEHGLTNANVKAEVQLYKKTEPGAVYDEMSCTFGTEIADLPASLNNYYAKYFDNRQKVVAFEQQYQTQFSSRQQQISSYDGQLSTMKSQINSEQSGLATEDDNLNAMKSQLQQLLASGQVAAYNSGVDSYNSQVNSYNTSITDLRSQIAQYNQLVDTRNSLAGQLTTLDSAIDTRIPSTVSP
jgi:hypothetical protein